MSSDTSTGVPGADAVIEAPWTETQVTALNIFQDCGVFRPFRCPVGWSNPAHTALARQRMQASGQLRAEQDGLHCRACGYRQTWAPAAAVELVLADTKRVTDAMTPDDIAWMQSVVDRPEEP